MPFSARPQNYIPSATNWLLMKILLADDSELTRECLDHFLTAKHLEVVIVQDGLEAIEQLAKHVHAFDLVISDVEMPQADGWQLLAWVQEHEAALPVVLMSGMSPRHLPALGARTGSTWSAPEAI